MNREKTCSICKIPINENYCPICGQKLLKKPTTTILLITDFVSNFFSMERAGFATMFKILKDPKLIVDNYYLGYRNYYSSPGQILLYAIAIVALHLNFVNDNVMGVILYLQNISIQYLFWLFLFPLLFFSSYLTFVRTEKSVSKHLISLIYIASVLFISLTILNDLMIFFLGDKLGIWTFIIFVNFILFWNSRVLTTKKKLSYVILNTIIQAIVLVGIISLFGLTINQLNNR